MQARIPALAALAALVFAAATPTAWGQTKPMHSGHMSHGAPQMRAQGSGVYHPNRPHYHHHYGYAGYRPTHQPYAPVSKQANEQGSGFFACDGCAKWD